MMAAPARGSLPAAKILVVDDDTNVADRLLMGLKNHGFDVHTATGVHAAMDRARQIRPDAVILDVAVGDMAGFGLPRRLRVDGIHAPVLFLADRHRLEDKIAGLTLGADDYITKPFSMEELIARLRAILRRTRKSADSSAEAPLTFADLTLDEQTREVWKAGEQVPLSRTEFTLLRYFIVNAGHVLSKQQIVDHVWPYDFHGDLAVVESYVSYLRRKLDAGGKPLIHTLRGLGYILRESH